MYRCTNRRKASSCRRSDREKAGHDLAGPAAGRDPRPAHVGPGTHEASKLVQPRHVVRLGRQKRRAQRRQSFGFFVATKRCRHAPPRRRAGPRAGAVARPPPHAGPRFCVPGPWGAAPGSPRGPRSETVGGRRRSCRFDDALAAARRAVRLGLRRQRRCSCHHRPRHLCPAINSHYREASRDCFGWL